MVLQGYRWIADEIERLDPEKVNERTFQFIPVYHVDDLVMDLLYATVSRGGHGTQTIARPERGTA